MAGNYPPNVFPGESEQRELFFEAGLRLKLLGLELGDLNKFRRILDLGAGLCHIERAARLEGRGNVVSAGMERPKGIEGLNFHQLDALKGLEFRDNEFDLVLSRKGPFLLCKTREEALTLLSETLRVCSSQIRINPTRFGYIKEAMFSEFPVYGELNGKVRTDRKLGEREKWKQFNLEANRRTQADLQKLGYDFSIIPSVAEGTPGIEDDYGYMFIKRH